MNIKKILFHKLNASKTVSGMIPLLFTLLFGGAIILISIDTAYAIESKSWLDSTISTCLDHSLSCNYDANETKALIKEMIATRHNNRIDSNSVEVVKTEMQNGKCASYKITCNISIGAVADSVLRIASRRYTYTYKDVVYTNNS